MLNSQEKHCVEEKQVKKHTKLYCCDGKEKKEKKHEKKEKKTGINKQRNKRKELDWHEKKERRAKT